MITFAKDTIDNIDINELCDWLRLCPKLTKGEETLAFEHEWSEWLGVKHSVFVNSGSSANFMMFLVLRHLLAELHSKSLNFTQRYKVVIPAVSWITSVSPALLLNYDVILCDCDENDLGLDVNAFEQLCAEHNPDAVLVVHVLGHPNKMDRIVDICKQHDVLLLEDCCESHGAQWNGQTVGTFGVMSSFSYYFGHHISTIEGGMICTNALNVNDLLLMYRSHGWLRDVGNMYRDQVLKHWNIDEFDALYTFAVPGMNLRSTDLQAYLGRLQMKKLDRSVNNRNDVYKKLCVRLRKTNAWIQTSNNSFVSSLAFGLITAQRELIVKALQDANIECRPLICGNIQNHPFWNTFGLKRWHTPYADIVHKYGFYIPCHQELTAFEIDSMCTIIEKFVKCSNENVDVCMLDAVCVVD